MEKKEETYISRVEREIQAFFALFKRNKTLAVLVLLIGAGVVLYQSGYLKNSNPNVETDLATKVIEQADAYKKLVLEHNGLKDKMAASKTAKQEERISALENELNKAKKELETRTVRYESQIDPEIRKRMNQLPSAAIEAWKACIQMSSKGGDGGSCDALLKQGIYSSQTQTVRQ